MYNKRCDCHCSLDQLIEMTDNYTILDELRNDYEELIVTNKMTIADLQILTYKLYAFLEKSIVEYENIINTDEKQKNFFLTIYSYIHKVYDAEYSSVTKRLIILKHLLYTINKKLNLIVLESVNNSECTSTVRATELSTNDINIFVAPLLGESLGRLLKQKGNTVQGFELGKNKIQLFDILFNNVYDRDNTLSFKRKSLADYVNDDVLALLKL